MVDRCLLVIGVIVFAVIMALCWVVAFRHPEERVVPGIAGEDEQRYIILRAELLQLSKISHTNVVPHIMECPQKRACSSKGSGPNESGGPIPPVKFSNGSTAGASRVQDTSREITAAEKEKWYGIATKLVGSAPTHKPCRLA